MDIISLIVLEPLKILLYGVVGVFQLLAPASTGFSNTALNSISTIIGYMFSVSYVLPVTDILIIIQLTVGFELVLLFIGFLRFVLNLLRGSGA
jgi:hypothetical protein